MLDYDEVSRSLSGLTSVTLMNILESLANKSDNFSYVIYAAPKDCYNEDLWANARENHVIVNSNTYKNTPHWFGMGRFIDDNMVKYDGDDEVGDVTYFMYCSVNTVPEIFTHHQKSLYKQMIKDVSNGYVEIFYDDKSKRKINLRPRGISLRMPTVQNQDGGNTCGLWMSCVSTLLANKQYDEFYNYLTCFKDEKELLKLSGKNLTLPY